MPRVRLARQKMEAEVINSFLWCSEGRRIAMLGAVALAEVCGAEERSKTQQVTGGPREGE